MSDDRPEPCWYTGGTWYDADRKPVDKNEIFSPAVCINSNPLKVRRLRLPAFPPNI